MCICATLSDMPGIWYLSGVYDGLPVLTLSRDCALSLSADRAVSGLRWCRSVRADYLSGVRWRLVRA